MQTQENKHIEIVGITEEDRVKYAESIFSSQQNTLVHFLRYSFSNPTMMFIPLLCAIVAQIDKSAGVQDNWYLEQWPALHCTMPQTVATWLKTA